MIGQRGLIVKFVTDLLEKYYFEFVNDQPEMLSLWTIGQRGLYVVFVND